MASWNNANKITDKRLTNSFIVCLEECPKYKKAIQEWNALKEHQQTWAQAPRHFKEANQKLQHHAQQTADSQGYANYDNSIASTIADINVKHAKTLEAISKLSQSTHATQAKNIQ